MKRRIFLAVALIVTLLPMAGLANAVPAAQEEVYTGQKDDSLWALVEKYLGSGSAYPAIVMATGAKRKEDETLTYIADLGLIQPRWIVSRYVVEPIVFKYKLDRLRERCLDQSEAGRAEQAKIPEGLALSPFQGLLYVPNQVILTGSPSAISTSIGTLELNLEPTGREFDLSYSSKQQQTSSESLAEPYEVAIQLYQMLDGKTVEQVVCEINGLRGIKPKEFAAFADPNYYISPAPWSGGGSPWTQNGEWVEEDGGGWGKEAQLTDFDFLDQWALGPDGIELFDANQVRTTEYRGDGIRVAVFDTSPFDDVPINGISVEPIPGVTPPLTLTVRHRELVPAPNCPGRDRLDPCIDREKQDISNHGLFVAGLVHAVAPHSEIHLIRVLENDGCGDLFAIESAIDSFITETLNERRTLKGTVINLSLGVHQPPDTETLRLPKEVVSLQRTIQRAIEHGAVVVAAAGNDSYDKPTATSMEIPANDPPVIGVAASNTERKRGCFSNEGDMAAPGGDGINLPGGDEEDSCKVPGKHPQDPHKYVCQEEPSFCLISLVHKPYPGYAYWVGTSFSTPLVSGLAALMLEKESELIISTSSVNVASTISTTITAGACPPATPPTPHCLGAGIVNVRHAMRGSACPAPILTP